MEFIHGTTLVHLKIRCWSGKKKMSRDNDIQLGTGGILPPKKLIDLGRKKIFPPTALKPFTNARKAAERECLAIGTRFMGGYSIPDHLIDDLEKTLTKLSKEFELYNTQFMSEYDDNKAAWLEENKEFAHVVCDQIPPRTVLENAFRFSFGLYKLDPAEGHEPDGEDFADQVLHEIGLSFKELERGLLDRKTATSGASMKKSLTPIMTKLDLLSFGNGRIIKILQEVETFRDSISLERLNRNHKKYGQALIFFSMCSCNDKLQRIIDGDFSVIDLINPTPAVAIDEAVITTPLKHVPAVTQVANSAYF